MEETRKKRTMIAFDVAPDYRQAIKVRALKKNMSMNLWIIRAINAAMREEDKKR